MKNRRGRVRAGHSWIEGSTGESSRRAPPAQVPERPLSSSRGEGDLARNPYSGDLVHPDPLHAFLPVVGLPPQPLDTSAVDQGNRLNVPFPIEALRSTILGVALKPTRTPLEPLAQVGARLGEGLSIRSTNQICTSHASAQVIGPLPAAG